MQTTIIEATIGQALWSSFLVGQFDWETAYRSKVDGSQILGMNNPRDILVLDIYTREGAVFGPTGYARSDIDKHRIWTSPLFESFLVWLREQLAAGTALADLPRKVELTSSTESYRHDGPLDALLKACLKSADKAVRDRRPTGGDAVSRRASSCRGALSVVLSGGWTSTEGCMTDTEVAVQIALRTIHRQLLARRWSIATAESLTAGLIAAELASQSGSSAYLKGGIVAYTLEAKVSLLFVNQAKAAACNCVSLEVAKEMAQAARLRFGTYCAVAVTGYAEPYEGYDPIAHYCILCNENMSAGTIQGGSRSRNEVRQLVTAAVLTTLAGMLEVAA